MSSEVLRALKPSQRTPRHSLFSILLHRKWTQSHQYITIHNTNALQFTVALQLSRFAFCNRYCLLKIALDNFEQAIMNGIVHYSSLIALQSQYSCAFSCIQSESNHIYKTGINNLTCYCWGNNFACCLHCVVNCIHARNRLFGGGGGGSSNI